MTALDRYVRLEALGAWRERPDAEPCEVIVTFGKTTLVLRDLDERPLAHWDLAGVRPIAERGGAAVYAMTELGEETLTIRDRDMIAAIAAMQRVDWEAPSAPGRQRRLPIATLMAAALLAGVGLVGPGLVRDQAARMLPPERAEEFGDRMLIALVAAHGAPCAEPAGQRALDRIAARLAPEAPPDVRAIDLGGVPAATLPGATVLVARDALRADAPPEALAGWIALALGRDPELALTRDVGAAAMLRYVLTGGFDDAALARAAGVALRPPEPEEIPPAMARLAAAGIDARPFAAALGLPDLPAARAVAPLLTPAEQASLRSLCG